MGTAAPALAELSQLICLDLSCTHITDSGFLKLEKLTKLEKLILGYTKLSDVSISVIANYKNLKYLNISGTSITKSGISKLKQTLPGTTVVA